MCSLCVNILYLYGTIVVTIIISSRILFAYAFHANGYDERNTENEERKNVVNNMCRQSLYELYSNIEAHTNTHFNVNGFKKVHTLRTHTCKSGTLHENNGASIFKPISLMYSMLKLKLKNIRVPVYICFNSGIMVCVTQSGFQFQPIHCCCCCCFIWHIIECHVLTASFFFSHLVGYFDEFIICAEYFMSF